MTKKLKKQAKNSSSAAKTEHAGGRVINRAPLTMDVLTGEPPKQTILSRNERSAAANGTLGRLEEQFGREGAQIVRDYIGEIADESADRSARAAFQQELDSLFRKVGVAEATSLGMELHGTKDPERVAFLLSMYLQSIREAIHPEAMLRIAPLVAVLERAAGASNRRERGLSDPPEFGSVACAICTRIHELNSTEYVTFHGPITAGEETFLTAAPVRICAPDIRPCFDDFVRTLHKSSTDAVVSRPLPESPFVFPVTVVDRTVSTGYGVNPSGGGTISR